MADIISMEENFLRKARSELMQVVTIIDNASRDVQSYQTVKNMIEEDRIAIPKNLRQYVRTVFYPPYPYPLSLACARRAHNQLRH
jgi:hypothetical protein